MAVAAPKPFKITYTSANADMTEFHRLFDSALAAVKSRFGQEHPLYIDGKAVLFEDDKGDGKQSISVIKDNSTYDQFIQEADGSLKPVSSDDLTRIRANEK